MALEKDLGVLLLSEFSYFKGYFNRCFGTLGIQALVHNSCRLQWQPDT